MNRDATGTNCRSRREQEFAEIQRRCAFVTATDAKHAPYLFNALASMQEHFPDHPKIYVYDLGISAMQRRELSRIPWLELRDIERFVPHWKKNWSWKPYILTHIEERYVLYFDAANIVLYRPLRLWFQAIARQGYFLINNGQLLRDITPSDYWSAFGLDAAQDGCQPTFGAGLVGFDNEGQGGRAVRETLVKTVQGWTLGRSANELRRIYDDSVIRDCPSFRADQTLLNLTFRKYFGTSLVLRDERRYCGLGGPNDHPRQYLWYARRKRSSLLHFWKPLGASSWVFWFNRFSALLWIVARESVRDSLSWWSRRHDRRRLK